MRSQGNKRKYPIIPIPAIGLTIAIFVIVVLLSGQFVNALTKSHPLPPTLAQWHDPSKSGDYFEQVQPTKVGYLIWSQLPVKIYVETPAIGAGAIAHQRSEALGVSASSRRDIAWVKTVSDAVMEWNIYLPLVIVPELQGADIAIVRSVPPLQILPGSKFPRARSALTSYELYTQNNILSHRCKILLSPSQTGEYLTAATRHEFGHALGIWGHSPLQTDTMYFSQVRHPPAISARDVNTLQKIYAQPTSLGW